MPFTMPGKEEPELYVIKTSYGDRIVLEMPRQMVTATGLAMPPLDHRTQRSPFQDGETFLGYSLRPRPVQFAIHMRGCNRLDMWEMRRNFQYYINPIVGPLRIQVRFRDGKIFELHNVMYDAQFDVGTDGQPGPAVQDFAVRFMAFDPVWYEHPANSTSATTQVLEELLFREEGDVGGFGIKFPLSFPISFSGTPFSSGNGITFPIIFGEVYIDQELTIITDGNYRSYPTITLTGPLLTPKIENLTTGEKLELNYKILTGETVIITTEFGNKTVKKGTQSLLGFLTTDSDLATFHIDPHPIATNGENIFSFIAYECSPASGITVEWYDRFIGI